MLNDSIRNEEASPGENYKNNPIYKYLKNILAKTLTDTVRWVLFEKITAWQRLVFTKNTIFF